MCGRFVQAYSWQEINDLLDLVGPPQNIQPRYNVAPTQQIDVVYRDDGERKFAKMRWGLIPFWWKKPASEAPSTFNARAETVAEKPFFRASYNKTRCIIPASGFYEWVNRGKDQPKQPFYISAKDEKPLLFAGLWSPWKDVETEEDRLTATIIVTKANDTLSDIHDRMPVILDPDDVKPWLNGALGSELLEPAPEEKLTYWPVSTRVNKTGSADDASLIEAVENG
jgi:putative SOS response-associated peptidase YedK